jgi:RNA recognition motif-containing protein
MGGMSAPGIQKPNPYAIPETKFKGTDGAEVTFKYPRSKIFVGGLDFKLTVDELRNHFQQYGDVVDACILKDIYTGQSRGFGFVTFKDEDVAQNLINNIQVTTINGRKADIKTAEVKQGQKQGGGYGGGPGGGGGFSRPGGSGGFRDQNAGPATIPPYGSGKDDSSGGGSSKD